MLVQPVEQHDHLHLAPGVHLGALAVSAATIVRLMPGVRTGSKRHRWMPPSAAERAGADLFRHAGPGPGFFEAGLVLHSGPAARDSYIQTLVLTVIASDWTECAPLLVREQVLVTEVLDEGGTCYSPRCSASTPTMTRCS